MNVSLKSSISSSSETSEGTACTSPTSPPSSLNDSGYHDTSLDEMERATEARISEHLNATLVIKEDGGEFWGMIIRSCQLLEQVNTQLRPVEPAVFCHMIQHVHKGGRLWQLNAREGYVFKEISGEPTCGMNGPTFFEKLKFCEEMMYCPGWRSSFKFLEHDEVRNDDLFHNVSFKSAGEGNLTDITATISRQHTATAESDDDTTDSRVFVGDLQTIYKSHEWIFQLPAWDSDMQDSYLFSDGKSIDIRHGLNMKKEELPGYFFKIDLYNGTYRGSAIESLKTEDVVRPMIIKLPFCDKGGEKAIGAGRRKPSNADVMDFSEELEQQLQRKNISRPDPTLFFLRTVEGASVVLRCTEDRERFLGVEGGRLKSLAPNDDSYKTDRRLHFHRILPSQLDDRVLKIVQEKGA